MREVAKRMESQLRRSRVVLLATLPLAAVAAVGMLDHVQPVLRLIYIVAGFSLIIFLHELGHFMVARACSVKCLAFSIGIGPRMCGWRNGAGLTLGSDPYDPETLKKKELEKAALATAEGAATQSDMPQSARGGQHPVSVGDCDYRISWLPLGGYVRMLGQDDMDPTKVSDDPQAFNRRPIWQRMCIVSAGVIMNIIFAAVCFSIIFSPGIGVDFPPAVIGSVVYDSPAWKAGLRPGDRVTAIKGERYRGFLEFTDVQMASALAGRGEAKEFTIEHPNGKIETVSIVPKKVESGGLQVIGVAPMPGLMIGGDGSDYVTEEMDKLGDPTYLKNKAALQTLKDGDKILQVDGRPLDGDYLKLYSYVQTVNGKPVELTLEHKDGKARPEPLRMYPRLEPLPGTDYPEVLGLQPAVILGQPGKGPAADAGLKARDRVLAVGDCTNPTQQQMIDVISSHPGDPVQIRVLREGQVVTVTVTPKLTRGKGLINVPLGQDIEHLAFIPPGPDTTVGALNLPPEATIAAVDGQLVSNWQDIYGVLRTRSPDSPVKVMFKTPSGEKEVLLTYSKPDDQALRERLQYLLGLNLAYKLKTQVAANAWDAVLMGLDHTKKFVLNVYMTLAGLAGGTVDPSNLHGIVGITKVGYDVQSRGPVWLWYVLAMVSVNLAVANFLPLPIVDGGLFLLLIVEKIRGKPLSLKVQTAIQTVGIVLLAGLFLFVTYNDITGLLLK
jgi:regulator of sigma E protease